MNAEGKASISGATTPEEIGEFWDTHDVADYLDQTTDVRDRFESDIQSVWHLVALAPRLLQEAISRARRLGQVVGGARFELVEGVLQPGGEAI